MERNASILQAEAYTKCDTAIIPGVALSVLEYFELFFYPLRAEEILSYSSVICTPEEISSALEEQLAHHKIYEHNNYYSVNKDIKQQVIKREKGNKIAVIKTIDAKRIGRFIFGFPFVKFVGISGSLSKGYAGEKCDYDFFIITSNNRLWICRTILHLFKKITFLAGQQDKFCMNYFIDESALKIEEKNRFTATELLTLIPINRNKIYDDFLSSNNWIHSFFPNNKLCADTNIKTEPVRFGKKFLEFIFDHLFPRKLNKALMKLTDLKWRNKWARKDFPMEDYDLAFKTTLHVSKNHPLNHQKKVLEHLKKK